jgi:hypothetical protein
MAASLHTAAAMATNQLSSEVVWDGGDAGLTVPARTGNLAGEE